MEDPTQLKPKDNHGTDVQLKPAENALSFRQDETSVGSTDGNEINPASNASPENHNAQQAPISDSVHHSTIEGVTVPEATASTAGEEEKQTNKLGQQGVANEEAEPILHNEHDPKTADPLNTVPSSVQKTPDEIKTLDASPQPNYGHAKHDNKHIQRQNNPSAEIDASTKKHANEKPLGEVGQQEHQGSTNLSISTLKEEQHSITMTKDQEVQCGEGQVNEGKERPKAPDKFRYDALYHIVAGIALAVALYTQFISIPNLKKGTPSESDSSHFPQVWKSKEEFRKRLDSVESSIKDSMARIKGCEESFKKLKAVAYKDDIANLVQKTDFQDRVKEIEQSLFDQESAKVEEVKSLQNQFQKLKDEVSMLNEGNSGIKNEQEELKTNVMTLEDQLVKQSKYVEKKTAEVEKEVSQHKEDVRSLNLSLENFENNIKNLNETLKGISVETLVLDKRTEDIKENIFDKVSLIVVIMLNTVLIVAVIIYLAAKRDNNRQLNWNVDIEEQETAGRILSQVRANPHLERKLCVISFYEETHPLHMRMTHSVTEQLTIQTVEYVIRRHEEILNIPPVVLFFLFVDFNERNVILEDPTLGLGDLRLTTVQAVQKMGGQIVVFYVRDQNSRQLDSTKLYNEDLVSVTRQRELSDLNRRSRFISAYEQLTDFQKTHLRRIVGNELTSR
ncbi:hypothetical protein ACJMK2_026808 [Sinanodonta woodiana]|uniref:Uncharacterized protein n=1 Tax=Sinanodonta woodiana TaxID=1069815 RepID=A0ABD3XMC9_SINWO